MLDLTLIFFFFLQLYCLIGISLLGNSGLLSVSKANCDRVALPNLRCMLGVYFHNPPNSDTDHGIFNVRTDVNACDCARGFKHTVRESALKVDSGRKIPCRTGESNLPERRAGPTLYQLSYIPNEAQRRTRLRLVLVTLQS